jgi:hypothetical protein
LAGARQRRSRKRGRRGRAPRAGGAAAGAAQAKAPLSRSEERNAAVRATLVPLAPNERPWALRIACLIALLIAVSNVVQVVVGGRVEFDKRHLSPVGPLIFSALMLVCAVGMWRKRYWAVLGFQALLGLVILLFALLLVRASNLLAIVVSVGVVGGGGFLFYKLVRVLSRIQMPPYPGGSRTGRRP